eukprot:TRINITY_DN3835_c0_g1_i3.p1 TRINITY_DN3835_c0_g1~~TRINITY_DN3835_c0_g1_i3.p1  ORF type:complete len:289 (+),score=62.18 TRINITY_DN3835_c0_g1_i3:117-983(+)
MSTPARQAELKVREGNTLLKKGVGLTKKTLTRWKPDWDNAAQAFEQAATCFKNGKAWDKAVEASRQGSNAHYKCENLYASARMMENAGTMCREIPDFDLMVKSYQEASMIYRESGNGSKAAEMLSKAGTNITDADPAKAVELLLSATEIYIEEEKEIYSNDTFKRAIALMCRNEMWDKAIETLQTQAKIYEKLDSIPNQHKAYLSIIVLYLHQNDYEGADRAFQEFLSNTGFTQSEEGKVGIELLDAWEKRDPEAVEECVKKQTFNFLDNQISRIAKKLRCEDGESLL